MSQQRELNFSPCLQVYLQELSEFAPQELGYAHQQEPLEALGNAGHWKLTFC
jgi:hypothetical protein